MAEPPLQKVITDLFRDFKGDETGGVHAMRGFSFQVWHAVLEALRAHGRDGDYAVVLEWEQDIAVLNSSSAPTQVRFIQLKKNESSLHWTLNTLLAEDKPVEETEGSATEEADATAAAGATDAEDARDATAQQVGPAADVPEAAAAERGKRKAKVRKKHKAKPSILAKLYQHRRRFQDCQSSRLEFVSNAPYKVTTDEHGEIVVGSVELSKLPDGVRTRIEKEVRKQLELDAEEVFDISDIGLLQSHGILDDAHKYAAGELDEMLLKGCVGAGGKSSLLCVLVLASYIHLRAGKRSFARDYTELLARGIKRAEVDGFLAATSDRNESTKDLVEKAIEMVSREGMPFPVVKNMSRVLTQACVEITNRAGPVPLVAARLKDLYIRNGEYDQFSLLREQLDAWYSDFVLEAHADSPNLGKPYLFCLMLMIVQNANPIYELPPLSLDSQLEDGK